MKRNKKEKAVLVAQKVMEENQTISLQMDLDEAQLFQMSSNHPKDRVTQHLVHLPRMTFHDKCLI